ncbi:MAG TPA: type II toxin-antitoxin system RelE/ParE family toxin [Verrucomicrobiae bacterium]|nr:type II toxin-antitoxin system RelE/ParE family toxin [Verrucomicrobiae bacterium]
MPYQIQFSPQAQRQLRRLPQDHQTRIVSHIDALAENPRPHGCKKLRGEENFWRIRIGDYRVIYQIRDKIAVVIVLVIGHRREIYR